MSGPRLVYNRDATSTVVSGDTVAWISSSKTIRRPPASKRYRMQRARGHARRVNRVIHYFRKLGWRGDYLVLVVRSCVESWNSAWDPDDDELLAEGLCPRYQARA